MTAKTRMKALTIRIPVDMHEAARALALMRQVSLSNLVGDSLRERILYDAFTELGKHPEECDVSWAWPLFVEAVEQDDALAEQEQFEAAPESGGDS